MLTTGTRLSRLLMVGAGYPPHGPRGGYELSWASFARHVRDLGVATQVLTTAPGRTGAVHDEEDVIRRLDSYRAPDGSFRTLSIKQRMQLEMHDNAVLRGAIRDFQPDAVMFWVMGGLPVSLVQTASRSRAATALWVCDLWTEYGLAVDAWQRLGRRAGRWSTVLSLLPGVPSPRVRLGELDASWIFPSTYLRGRVVAAAGIDPARTHVVPSPVDALFFADSCREPANEPRPWGGRLLFCGRLTEAKGADVAIRAVARCAPATTLTLAGEPGDVDASTLSRQCGVQDRVTPRPSLSRADVGRLMGRSDALLFPTRSTEALGLVPLEAMAVGTPVVMTVTGGPADYARHEENCLVVEPGDVAAVVNAVQRLEGDNRLRARLIAGGHATAEAYQGDRCNAAALSIVAEAAA